MGTFVLLLLVFGLGVLAGMKLGGHRALMTITRANHRDMVKRAGLGKK